MDHKCRYKIKTFSLTGLKLYIFVLISPQHIFHAEILYKNEEKTALALDTDNPGQPCWHPAFVFAPA